MASEVQPAPFRSFGVAEDLDLDLGHPDRPALVTTLLAQCTGSEDAAFWWNQPVAARTAALLRVVAVTEGRGEIEMTSRCGSCGETFGFDLPLPPVNPDGGVPPVEVGLADGRKLTLRRPRGADLRQWREAAASAPEPAELMITTLLLTGDPQPGDTAIIAEAMIAADPLVSFSASCRCPSCGADNEVPIDLEALALRRLASAHRTLLREIHDFARHYGWTEAEVLAVPSQRRARYRSMIDGR